MTEPEPKRSKVDGENKQDAHPVVSQAEWHKARMELLVEEKAITRARKVVAAKRQAMPWVKVQDYHFHGPTGAVRLSELFGDSNNLVVQHIMQGVTEKDACPMCCFWVDGLNGSLPHLSPRTAVVGVAAAPFEALTKLKQTKGWDVPLYSSHGSTFNHDFLVEFTEEERAAGQKVYNYKSAEWGWCDQAPGISVFTKRDGQVYHTYSTYGPGLAELNVAFGVCDILPEGRNEEAGGHMYWIRHKEKYGLPPEEDAQA